MGKVESLVVASEPKQGPRGAVPATNLRCQAITYGGNPIIVRCDREAEHQGSHATDRELQHGRI